MCVGDVRKRLGEPVVCKHSRKLSPWGVVEYLPDSLVCLKPSRRRSCSVFGQMILPVIMNKPRTDNCFLVRVITPDTRSDVSGSEKPG